MTQNIIFEFSQDPNYPVINLDDNLQLSFLVGNTGDKIGRLSFEEQPHYDNIIYHPDSNKIQKSLNNYLFMKGKLKVSYEWSEDENITQEIVDKFWELALINNPDDSYAIKFNEANKSGYIIDYGGYITEWAERSSTWEIASNKASLEALEDNTVVICAAGTSYGWNYKNIDLPSQQTTAFNKEGDICYILTGDNCEVTVGETTHTFPKYDCKKLTSSECLIKNVSNETTRIVAIYK
nr:hypothetical protein [uncultured Mediterranean phage uvMED]BAR25753.1 hypothetical protein [uncultured Mediterranean phage uvMED]